MLSQVVSQSLEGLRGSRSALREAAEEPTPPIVCLCLHPASITAIYTESWQENNTNKKKDKPEQNTVTFIFRE